MSRLPAAVLFDMDGLLIDSERIWFAVETEVMDHLGGPWGPDHQEALVGHALDRSAEYMLGLSGRTDVGPQDVAVLLLDGMVDAVRSGPVDWMPGAQRLLAEVEAAGVPRALVSSSSRVIMDAVLEVVGRSHFDVTVSGDDVVRTKPDPEPYLLAAQLLEVDATMCVALEDSPTGATSARAAGCVTVVVPSLVPVPDDLAHRQVDSLERVDLAVVADLLGSLRPA